MPLYLDDTTLTDLSIFEANDGNSIFKRFNSTRTQGGERCLKQYFSSPFNDLNTIQAVQSLLRTFIEHSDRWPTDIGNGTVVFMDKFLKYRFSPFKSNIHFLDRITYMVINREDYRVLRFNARIFGDFFRGIKKVHSLIHDVSLPVQYRYIQDKISAILDVDAIKQLSATATNHNFTPKENFYYCYHMRMLRNEIHDVMESYFRLEAWFSMAKAVKEYKLTFPEFVEGNKPCAEVKGLYNLMVEKPKSCDVSLDDQQRLLFLTGSNMSGKSTLIKAAGLAIYLGHLGMGVPAASMKLTTFDGLSSNINIEDDVTKGQSYFFNEVLRVKETILKIKNGKKWMILVDELFKGTNIVDAMQCSIDVIDGFSKVENALFIISTHLYEIAHDLQQTDSIQFKHLETIVDGDQFRFTYQLIDGISSERIGHKIMKQEGVLKMLQEL
jgi:DNA mismatch repair ATPase MutS